MKKRPSSSFSVPPTPADLTWIHRQLLEWFDANARELPWRQNRDAYRIWVSEVMLQQTQVATVIPYFDRFLRRFPTVADLAQAEEAEVFRLWEGLGYYRRARHLHQAAKAIVNAHQGSFPQTVEQVSELPGLGRYTTHAVLSQAFDQRLPILEANSVRVLSRWFAQRADPKSSAQQKFLWQLAEDLLPTERVGDYNQALMELGALVCKPANPDCANCPLRSKCLAFALGAMEEIPAPSKRPQVTMVEELAAVVSRGEELLLVQRPDHGRWAGLWEFPHLEIESRETPNDASARLLSSLGLQGEWIGHITTIKHSVTRFRISLAVHKVRFTGGTFHSSFYRAGKWVSLSELSQYPVSKPQRACMAILSKGE